MPQTIDEPATRQSRDVSGRASELGIEPARRRPHLEQDVLHRPGIYDLEVRLAGTNTVVLSIDGVNLGAGTVTTAFVVGSAAGGTLEPLAAQDAP